MNPHFGQFQCMRYRDDRDLDRQISCRLEALPMLNGTGDEVVSAPPVVRVSKRQLQQERAHQASLKDDWKKWAR